MKTTATRAGFAVAAVVVAVAGVSVRQDFLHVPRIRVGALHSDEPGRETMRFFALGDTGTGGPDQLKVAAAMNERCHQAGGAVDGILLLGDNAYPIGFASTEDAQWQSKIVEPYGGDCLAKVPIYAVLGNHDYKQNPAAEIEYTLLNPRWHMPNRFYSVTFGSLLKLVALDSNVTEMCFKPAFCGVDFMLESLAQRDTTWTFVMAHHPIASSSDHGFNYRGGIRGLLLKPYLCPKIDAYLSGHSHHLEHQQPDGCRMEIFVDGGGGGDLYQTDPRGNTDVKFARSAFGFLDLEVAPAQLTSRFVGEDGQDLYVTTKAASPR